MGLGRGGGEEEWRCPSFPHTLCPSPSELLIPDGANAFYAMNPAGPCDFVLRLKEGVPCPPAFRAAQSGSRAALRSTTTLKDLGTMAAAAASGLTLPQSPSHLGPLNSAPVCFPFPVMAPQHRSPSHLPSLLHPAPSSLSLNAQQPLDSPSSPPARLPHPSLTPEPFGPALPCSLLASPLQKPPSPASLEATVCSESPRNCVAPHFSAAQDGETVNRLAVLPNNGREVGP